MVAAASRANSSDGESVAASMSNMSIGQKAGSPLARRSAPSNKKPVVLAPLLIPGRDAKTDVSNGQGAATEGGEPFEFGSAGMPCSKFREAMESPSHLLVIDHQPDGLWRVDHMRELLLRRGCCVQLQARFGADGAASPSSA